MVRKVYPRVCGGTIEQLAQAFHDEGLSPRVRGNPKIGRESCSLSRSIPACAGEPSSLAPCILTDWVYPRVCGGTHRTRNRSFSWDGLSPRVRGNLEGLCPAAAELRSIPACAGEPHTRARWLIAVQVYPRVCGGTRTYGHSPSDDDGLSPRVRGNLMPVIKAYVDPGSIPACAGEPRWTCLGGRTRKVYPRVCGGT